MRQGGGLYEIAQRTIWHEHVRRGRAFAAPCSQGGVAGENPHAQLMNPAGSGRQLLLYATHLISSTVTNATFAFYNTALSTLQTAGINLLAGGAAGQGQARRQTNIGVLGTQFTTVFLAVDTQTYFEPLWVCELDPGEGVVVAGVTVASDLTAMFRWVEV